MQLRFVAKNLGNFESPKGRKIEEEVSSSWFKNLQDHVFFHLRSIHKKIGAAHRDDDDDELPASPFTTTLAFATNHVYYSFLGYL